jgi:hypothetical protein
MLRFGDPSQGVGMDKRAQRAEVEKIRNEKAHMSKD